MTFLSFKYTQNQLSDRSHTSTGNKLDFEERRLLSGELSSVSTLDNELRFEAIGAVPVPCRASVTRLAFMKLLGTGIFVGAVGIGNVSNPEIANSCAIAFSVNIVACAHYIFLWRIRAQGFGDTPYKAFMVGVGRGDNFNKGVIRNSGKLYAQETAVDGLRHSDWTVST